MQRINHHFYASSALKLTLAMAMGLLAGVAVKQAVSLSQSAWQITARAPALPAAPGMPSAPEAVQLATTVLVGDTALDTARSRVALPSDTRFKLQISSSHAGVVEVHVVNPEGQGGAAPLWSATASAGQQVLSPMLRLQGTRGIETIQVILRGPQQQVQAQRDIKIWHL